MGLLEICVEAAIFSLFTLHFFSFFVSLWTKLESNEITVRPLILHLVPAISPSHASTLRHFRRSLSITLPNSRLPSEGGKKESDRIIPREIGRKTKENRARFLPFLL